MEENNIDQKKCINDEHNERCEHIIIMIATIAIEYESNYNNARVNGVRVWPILDLLEHFIHLYRYSTGGGSIVVVANATSENV